MKKINGLKIFALVLLSLSKFETMFGMKEDEKEDNINDEYVNKNYYLIDALGNKITLDNGDDIKFKIIEDLSIVKSDINKDILKIHENRKEKTLVITTSDNEKEEEIYLIPILYKNSEVILYKVKKTSSLYPIGFDLTKKNRKKYEKNTIRCIVVEKIGEDSINDDYILVDAKNNKIEKIKDKNIVFKLLTRKKYLELKKKLKDPENYLKNDEGKYIINILNYTLFFEEEDNDLILYVRRLKNNLCLAWLYSLVTTINFNKDNYIEVRMAKKKKIDKVAKKKEEDDSSECCCCIC